MGLGLFDKILNYTLFLNIKVMWISVSYSNTSQRDFVSTLQLNSAPGNNLCTEVDRQVQTGSDNKLSNEVGGECGY